MNRQASPAFAALCILLSGTTHAEFHAAQQETLTVLKAGGDERKQYFLMPSGETHTPDQQLGLILVLPGGDGSAGHTEFVELMAGILLPFQATL